MARAAALLADARSGRAPPRPRRDERRADRPGVWRRMFPSLFGRRAAADGLAAAEAVLAVSLEVADRGDQVRSQIRGAIVEALTAGRCPTRRGPRRGRPARAPDPVRRGRGRDPPVRRDGRDRRAAEAWDCKWGARGIGPDVLHQLDDARSHAADEDERLTVGLVVFDARRSCEVRLDRQTAPHAATELVTIETLDRLAVPTRPTDVTRGRPPPPTPPRRRPGDRGRTAASARRAAYRVRFDEAARPARSGRRCCSASPRTWPRSIRSGAGSAGPGTGSAVWPGSSAASSSSSMRRSSMATDRRRRPGRSPRARSARRRRTEFATRPAARSRPSSSTGR